MPAPQGRIARPVILPLAQEPAEAEFVIAGRCYIARIWSYRDWQWTAEQDRPGHAIEISPIGWMTMEPSGN